MSNMDGFGLFGGDVKAFDSHKKNVQTSGHVMWAEPSLWKNT